MPSKATQEPLPKVTLVDQFKRNMKFKALIKPIIIR